MQVKKIIQALAFLFIANSGLLLVLIFSQSSQGNVAKPSIILVDNSGSMGICSVMKNGRCVPNARVNALKFSIIKRTHK